MSDDDTILAKPEPESGGAPSVSSSSVEVDQADTGDERGRSRWLDIGLGALALVVILSIVRAATDAVDVTSTGTIAAAMRLAIPIGLAALGGLWAERAGVVNIGLEGMMILGTWFGAWAGWQWGPWWGVLAGVSGGALGGLLHAMATVSFGVDHIVSGVALNILAAGATRYLSVLAFEGSPGGGVTQSPPLDAISTVTVPVLSGGIVFGWHSPDPLSRVSSWDWVVVSDLARILRALTADVSLLTIVAVALVPLSYLVLWRTPFGLRLRACGERPVAAESLGISVYKMKYLAVCASGAFAGLAGAFLVTVSSSIYREGQTAGRGYIGLAAMIFGNWRPAGLAAGAGLFGYADALQLRQSAAVHAMVLFVAILLGLLAARSALAGRVRAAVAGAIAGAAFLLWFVTSDEVPSQLVFFTPHITTLLVLSLAAQHLRPPAADGVRYRKGDAD